MCVNQSHHRLELEQTLGIPYFAIHMDMTYILEHVQSSIVGYKYATRGVCAKLLSQHISLEDLIFSLAFDGL